ncbi:MAG: TIGR04283 family arsenosugar biosynthesis glycosyltransferase [Pseudomonadota bacterium]
MPAPISVVIPTLNAAGELAASLDSLMPGLQAGLIREVIVSDGGSDDATLAVTAEGGCVLVEGPAGRGAQLIAGAEVARGGWLLFLHADTILSRDWAERVADHIADHSDKAAAFALAYRSDAPEAKWLAARANRRARWFGLPYGDQGLLISRGLYDAVGGFDDAPLMEDVAIVRRIGKSRLRLLSAEARTSAAKYERDGWRRRAYRNAWLAFRYYCGASPEALAKVYD